MTLVELIHIVSDAYPDGLVEDYFREPEGGHGDGLAKFVASEIAETFDPEAPTALQLSEAQRVMDTAANDLNNVCDALTEAWVKEQTK